MWILTNRNHIITATQGMGKKVLTLCIITFILLFICFSGCINSADTPNDASNEKDVQIYKKEPIVNENANNSNPNAPRNLSNMWAIMATDDYADEDRDSSNWTFYSYFLLVYDCLVKIGFTEEQIVSCLNESFTKKTIHDALDYISDHSGDPNNATVVLWILSHGNSLPLSDGKLHSFLQVRIENSTNESPEWETLADYELDNYLDRHSYGKLLVYVGSCMSGCFAAQDTTGLLHGSTDLAHTSCGGPNRIIITDTIAPITSSLLSGLRFFWQEGLVNNSGDTAPAGNEDGRTSVEEAWRYFKTIWVQALYPPSPSPSIHLEKLWILAQQPCMNDQYPAENPEGEMFLDT